MLMKTDRKCSRNSAGSFIRHIVPARRGPPEHDLDGSASRGLGAPRGTQFRGNRCEKRRLAFALDHFAAGNATFFLIVAATLLIAARGDGVHLLAHA